MDMMMMDQVARRNPFFGVCIASPPLHPNKKVKTLIDLLLCDYSFMTKAIFSWHSILGIHPGWMIHPILGFRLDITFRSIWDTQYCLTGTNKFGDPKGYKTIFTITGSY
jgi:hypothetical protein